MIQEKIITQNVRETARMIPKDASASYLTDSLLGVLSSEYDLDDSRMERLKVKYELTY